jgi:hypothetical protein
MSYDNFLDVLNITLIVSGGYLAIVYIVERVIDSFND